MPETDVQIKEVPNEIVDNIWSDEPKQPEFTVEKKEPAAPEAQTIPEVPPATPAPTAAAPAKQPELQPDINAYLKELGFDTQDAAKEAIAKWKQLEAEPKVETKEVKPTFANEESEKLYNAFLSGDKASVTSLLKKQEEIENAEKLSPIEQIKLDLKYKNPKYNSDDIQDIVEEKYSYPSKPNKEELDEDEYATKMAAYEKEVAKIERRIKRDGQEAVENLQKQKQDLVLPDINNSSAEYQKHLNQQKELEVEENKVRDNYKAALEKEYSGFNGYKTSYKDKEVDVPIEYKPTEQELKDLKTKFSEDFDADEYFAKRWFKTQGEKVVGFNVPTQMEDIYLLENKQKVFDRIANDAAMKAIDAYQKGEKNIKFKPDATDTTPVAEKHWEDKLADKLWA